jgi:hypothetical protein
MPLLNLNLQQFSRVTVSSQVPLIVYPALQSLIANRLQKSLDMPEVSRFQGQNTTTLDEVATNLSHSQPFRCQNLPVNRMKVTNRVEYVSALAFKLQSLYAQPVLELAEQIVVALSSPSDLDQPAVLTELTDRIWQHFVISVHPPGWIHLQLADPGLAEWLQGLGSCSWSLWQDTASLSSPPFSNFDCNSPEIFAAMHSHARCWSLLQLAAQENLIQIAERVSETGAVLEQSIPWLDTGQKLRGQQPEWSLILQISDTLDYLAQPKVTTAQQSLKVLHGLSRMFQAFHAARPVWGVRLRDPSLAQVQLGLTLITQKLLHILLTRKLRLEAPFSL